MKLIPVDKDIDRAIDCSRYFEREDNDLSTQLNIDSKLRLSPQVLKMVYKSQLDKMWDDYEMLVNLYKGDELL